MILCCNLRGSRLGDAEDRFQGPQIAIAGDLVEPPFRSDEERGQRTNHRLAPLPAGNAAGQDAHSSMRTFDDVGCGQAAHQRRRQAHPVDDEYYLCCVAFNSDTVPSETFSRLFRNLNPDQFPASFQRFMTKFSEHCQGFVAIDGKVFASLV